MSGVSAYLQQAVHHLCPHIVLVALEKTRLEKLEATSRNVVFSLEIFI
jgi:hypothetical protein